MKFNQFNLSSKLLSAIEQTGYIEATPIQELTIPAILEKKDVVGLAQTGTGKTAAFSLPIINRLLEENKADRKIKALILSPTRELAIQIRDNVLKYAQNTNFKCSVILGGVNQQSQVNVLSKGIDILVATPGRLVDLINQKKADLSNVQFLVLDEADTMLDMGFIKDITFLINKTPENRQTLLFSATMPKEVAELSKKFMNHPITIKTQEESLTVDKIKQELYYVDKPNKFNLLLDVISQKDLPTTLIFTRTKHGANDLEKKLNDYQIKTSVIHGNKTQSNRVKAISDFKQGKTKILIATDIASRGIDIHDLGLVINYDIPEKAEIYVHRIGRTARAGKDGRSMSFCSSAELADFKSIEKLMGKTISPTDHKYPMVLQEKKPVQGQNRRTQPKQNSPKKQSGFSKQSDSPRQEGFSKRSDSPRPGGFSKRSDSPRPGGFSKRSDSPRPGGFSKRSDSPRPGGFSNRSDSPRPGGFSKRSDSPRPGGFSKRSDSPRPGSFSKRSDSPRPGGFSNRSDSPRPGGFSNRSDSPRPGGFSKRSDSPRPGGFSKRSDSPRPGGFSKRSDSPRPGGFSNRSDSPRPGGFSKQSDYKKGPSTNTNSRNWNYKPRYK